MGLGGVDAEAEKAVGLSRLEGADSMVSTLLISVLVVAVIGGLFIAFVLPKIAAKFADFTYNQNTDEFVAPTKLDEARSLVLQGEFERAVKVFREYIGESEVQDRLAYGVGYGR